MVRTSRTAFAFVSALYSFGMTATLPIKKVCTKPGTIQAVGLRGRRPGPW